MVDPAGPGPGPGVMAVGRVGRQLVHPRSYLSDVSSRSPVGSSSNRGRRACDSSWIVHGDRHRGLGTLQRPLLCVKAEESERAGDVTRREGSAPAPRLPESTTAAQESDGEDAIATIEASRADMSQDPDVTQPLSTVILQGGSVIAGVSREVASKEQPNLAHVARSPACASQQRASTEAIARTRCHSLDSIASSLARMRQALPQFPEKNPVPLVASTAPRAGRGMTVQDTPAAPHVGPIRLPQEDAFRAFQAEVRAELCTQAKRLQHLETSLSENLQSLKGAVHEEIDDRIGELPSCLEALRNELQSVAAEGEMLRAELQADPRRCACVGVCGGLREEPATPRQHPDVEHAMLSKDLEPMPRLLQQRGLGPQQWPPEAMVAYDVTMQVLRDKIEEEFTSCGMAVREMVECRQGEEVSLPEGSPRAAFGQQQQQQHHQPQLPCWKKASRSVSWASGVGDPNVLSSAASKSLSPPPGRFYDSECFEQVQTHREVPFPRRRRSVPCH